MLFQKCLWFVCRLMTFLTGAGSCGCTPGCDGAHHSWTYLSHWGPKMLITRNGELRTLCNAFAVVARFDENSKLLSCKPLVFMRRTDEKVIFGFDRVYTEYGRIMEQRAGR